jgi:predicted GNAT family N-acyltransferase
MVQYSFDRQIEPERLQGLLRQTGWANQRSIEGIQEMLQGTPLTLGAWEGDRLVGFARVITDGIYRALIDDVVVKESKRGTGIGSELMRQLVERLTEVEEVFLHCGEQVVSFYERHRFERSYGVVMNLNKD